MVLHSGQRVSKIIMYQRPENQYIKLAGINLLIYMHVFKYFNFVPRSIYP